jgi:hypothetical protein
MLVDRWMDKKFQSTVAFSVNGCILLLSPEDDGDNKTNHQPKETTMNEKELELEAERELEANNGVVGLQMFFVTENDVAKNAKEEIGERLAKMNDRQKAHFLSLIADEMYDTLTNKYGDDYFNEILTETIENLDDDGDLDELFEEAEAK